MKGFTLSSIFLLLTLIFTTANANCMSCHQDRSTHHTSVSKHKGR